MKKGIQNNTWKKMENKTQNIKGKQLFNQIAIHNREEKSCAC